MMTSIERKSSMILIMICLFLSMISIEAVSANLLTNYSFDSDVSDWTATYGTISHDSGGYSVAGSMRVDSEYTGPSYGHWGFGAQYLAASNETTYYFRVVGKCNVADGFSIHFQWYNETSVTGNTWLTTPTATGEWQIITWTGEAPTTSVGVDEVKIEVGVIDSSQAIHGFYDDIYFDTTPPPALSELPVPLFVPIILGLTTTVVFIYFFKRK